MNPSDQHSTEQPEVKTTVEARQAKSVGLKNVLIAGLVLVVIAFAGVAMFTH